MVNICRPCVFMRPELTERQRGVLGFIQDQIREEGYPPTVREIASFFRMKGPKGAHKHLAALEKKGCLTRTPGCSRAIRLAEQLRASAIATVPSVVSLPLIGQVRAGTPVLAEENIEGHVAVDRSLVPGQGAFLLRVQGESMTGAGILPGDMAAVRPQRTAENGEIVVALVDGEATVKRFYKDRDAVRLVPQNPSMRPIIVRGEVRIVGKVVAILRRLTR